MKRTIAALATTVVLSIGAGATYAAAAGVPEVDEANATFQLSPVSTFSAKACAGEDLTKYVTFRGAWAGGETDLSLSTDYVLTGKLTISKVVWTINLATQRGVLKGTASFVSDPSVTAAGDAQPSTYNGSVTLITQGLPSVAGTVAQARGWFSATLANTTTSGPNTGTLLANVEMNIAPGFAAAGEFGNQTMGLNDISVAFNNQTC